LGIATYVDDKNIGKAFVQVSKSDEKNEYLVFIADEWLLANDRNYR
jgi:hypothetical protein